MSERRSTRHGATTRWLQRGAARGVLLTVLAVMTLASSQVLVVVPASAEESKTKPTKPAPALESEPAPETVPDVPAGDFTNPPIPGERAAKQDPKASFDPAASVVIDAETTPTALVYSNKDGTRTSALSQAPVRFQDEAGAWRDIDHSVVAAPGGGLTAKSAPDSTLLGAKAEGSLATVATPAGPVALRHPDALAVDGVATKDGATYTKALPRDRETSSCDSSPAASPSRWSCPTPSPPPPIKSSSSCQKA